MLKKPEMGLPILISNFRSDPELKDRAWNAINFFLAHDIYRCNMMLEGLSKTAFASTLDFSRFEESTRRQCKPVDDGGEIKSTYRHFNKTNASRKSRFYTIDICFTY